MTETCSVSLKLPQFRDDGAKIWFQQAESQFAICNISVEQTKYHHVMAALPGEIAMQLQDLFEKVPEVVQYTAQKKPLLQKFSLTDLEKTETIMLMPVLGDRKPSDLMDALLFVCPTGQQMSPFSLMSFSEGYLGTCLNTFTDILIKILRNLHNKQIWCGQLNLDSLFSKFLLTNSPLT